MSFQAWILYAEQESRATRPRVVAKTIGHAIKGIVAYTAIVVIFFAAHILACATTPAGRARQVAVIQKTAVDGLGNAYLGYCEVVRRPRCVDADKAATQAGTPQTKADRVECLRPCDSATAEKIQTAVDVVRTAQFGLFERLRSGTATEEELKAQRSQLTRAADQLDTLLREAGVLDVLGDAVGGVP